jgi:outer membrane protein assembly factor BamB
LYKGVLYIPYLHQRNSFVAALDAGTGELKWRTERTTTAEDESKDAYSSPCVVEYPDRAEIVICGADLANAYDSQTGEEVWRHGNINPTGNRTLRIVVSPTSDGERIYVSSAKRGPVHAIQAGGRGDLTDTRYHLWTCEDDTPDVPTPALGEGLVYLLRENGVMTVLDAATGETIYKQRVGSRAGAFSPSPVVADGKVYLASEGGYVVVLAAGREFKLLAENELGELIMATPVVVDDCLFIRTENHLYCFQQRS